MSLKSGPKTLVIYTDGACSGNPGPGGWGVLMQFGDKEKTLKGGESDTTNNRMEMMAAIKALEAINPKFKGDVTLWTDSTYWQQLDALNAQHKVTWKWVKGHAGIDGNERADELARAGMPPRD